MVEVESQDSECLTKSQKMNWESLQARLFFDQLCSDHFFDIQSLPRFLAIELNWRLLPPESDANAEVDVEKHIREESEEYLSVLKVLQETQSMACFHGKDKIF